MAYLTLKNWKREIVYHPAVVEAVESADEIVRIMQDRVHYPSPVRARGSNHSTTLCIEAEGGTIVDMRPMNRILNVDKEARTVTVQAGVLHVELARELETHGLQLYVNCEIGNLTYGSGATCATKDASFHSAAEGWEHGQANSYVIGMKLVGADGQLIELTEADGELLEAARSSYGMLGIAYEVTLRVKDIKPMAVEHVRYHVDEFADNLEALIAGNRSMMLYLFPFLDTVMVEYRSEGTGPIQSHSWQWALRNFVWSKAGPWYGKVVSTFVPFRSVRSFLVNLLNRFASFMAAALIRGKRTSPADQIIRYPAVGGFDAYTFSIWAFPREEYPRAIRDYFQFCRDYYDENGYRCDLLNVGYLVKQDTSSLFSYTRDGDKLTLDPVSTGGTGWHGFLTAYNEFCSQHHGKPLLNQTPRLTALQVQAAFGREIQRFQEHRRRFDPDNRLYNSYFHDLFEPDFLTRPQPELVVANVLNLVPAAEVHRGHDR